MSGDRGRTNALVPPQYAFDKRWKDRRACWRHPGEVLNPQEYGVEVLTRRCEAELFIQQHHYAPRLPPARLCVGLFHKRGVQAARLSGLAAFTVPIRDAAIARYTGQSPSQGVELGRFVLLDEVPFNGETWFLRRAMRALWAEKGGASGVQAIISYADPMAYSAADGRLIKPAHAGRSIRPTMPSLPVGRRRTISGSAAAER